MKKRDKKKSLWLVFLIPLLSFLIGVAGEIVYNLPLNRQKEYDHKTCNIRSPDTG